MLEQRESLIICYNLDDINSNLLQIKFMEISVLKKEIHASIEELEDEKTLLEVVKVLERPASSLDYELLDEFQLQLSEAMDEAETGYTNTHEEVMEWFKNRGWQK